MKGIMKVNRLKNGGIFVSEIDWDVSYQDKSNPKGEFVMILESLQGFTNRFFYYEKIGNVYYVEGEAYILTGRRDILKKKIKKWLEEFQEVENVEFRKKDLGMVK